MMKSVALLLTCLGSMLTTLTLAAELGCSSESAQSKNKLDSLASYASLHRTELRRVQEKKESCAMFIENLTRKAQEEGLVPEVDAGVQGAKAIASMLENRAKYVQASFPGTNSLAAHVWHCIDLIGLPNGDLSTNNEADNSKPEAVAKERFDEEADSESEALVVSKANSEAEAQSSIRLRAYESENESLKVTNEALTEQLSEAIQSISDMDETIEMLVGELGQSEERLKIKDEMIEKLRSDLRQSVAQLNGRVNANIGNVGNLHQELTEKINRQVKNQLNSIGINIDI